MWLVLVPFLMKVDLKKTLFLFLLRFWGSSNHPLIFYTVDPCSDTVQTTQAHNKNKWKTLLFVKIMFLLYMRWCILSLFTDCIKDLIFCSPSIAHCFGVIVATRPVKMTLHSLSDFVIRCYHTCIYSEIIVIKNSVNVFFKYPPFLCWLECSIEYVFKFTTWCVSWYEVNTSLLFIVCVWALWVYETMLTVISDFVQVTSDMAQLLGEQKVDAILCVAGGWAGGNCSSKGQNSTFCLLSH